VQPIEFAVENFDEIFHKNKADADETIAEKIKNKG
jgi:hypothetical protein